MSIECLNQALKVEGLTPTKKLILVILGNYADEKGTCYPSYGHIAKIIGLKDTKGIQKTIKEFEQLGLLRIEHRKTINGGYTSNRYYMSIGGGGKTHRGLETLREGVLEPSNTKEETKTIIYNKEFESFWDLYPRKVSKKKTWSVFKKINDSEYEKIIIGVENLNKQNIDITYIPYPVTWLNQERWKDVPVEDKKSKSKLNATDWHLDLDL